MSDQFWFEDEDGNQFSPEEAQYLIESGEYQFADNGIPGSGEYFYTPDQTDAYGLRDRELWPNDQTERSAARYAAMQRMLNERNQDGD